MSDRKPQKHIVYSRVSTLDNRFVRFDVVKSCWKNACFSRVEVQIPSEVEGEDPKVKRVRVPNENYVPLKYFVRHHCLTGAQGEGMKANAQAWVHNKRANTANPPKGIGRTSKSKNAGKK